MHDNEHPLPSKKDVPTGRIEVFSLAEFEPLVTPHHPSLPVSSVPPGRPRPHLTSDSNSPHVETPGKTRQFRVTPGYEQRWSVGPDGYQFPHVT